jgi:hypothetical protein
MDSPERLADGIVSASKTLSMIVALSVEKGFFGKLKPTDLQIGWAYGFCDGFAQWIGLKSDEEFILFISLTFEKVFGKTGLKYFQKVAWNQNAYAVAIQAGGSAHHKWSVDGTVPLMPLRR